MEGAVNHVLGLLFMLKDDLGETQPLISPIGYVQWFQHKALALEMASNNLMGVFDSWTLEEVFSPGDQIVAILLVPVSLSTQFSGPYMVHQVSDCDHLLVTPVQNRFTQINNNNMLNSCLHQGWLQGQWVGSELWSEVCLLVLRWWQQRLTLMAQCCRLD